MGFHRWYQRLGQRSYLFKLQPYLDHERNGFPSLACLTTLAEMTGYLKQIECDAGTLVTESTQFFHSDREKLMTHFRAIVKDASAAGLGVGVPLELTTYNFIEWLKIENHSLGEIHNNYFTYLKTATDQLNERVKNKDDTYLPSLNRRLSRIAQDSLQYAEMLIRFQKGL